MLVLNSKDIYSSLEPAGIIEAIEKAFLIQKKGNYLMPDRLHLAKNKNTQLVMPCIAEDMACTKIVSINPDNQSKKLPIINGSVQLVEHNTGKILCLLKGSTLTALRTGGIGAVAAKYLTQKNASHIGLVGTGVQGLHVLWMISHVRHSKQFNIFNYDAIQTELFCVQLAEKVPYAKIHITDSKRDLLDISEVIVTATNSPSPVLPEDIALLKNKVYICIGSFSPVMGELPRSIYSLVNKMYIDVEYAKYESGDVSYPLEQGILKDEDVILFNEVIFGKIPDNNSTKIFKSVGMALFDLTTSLYTYQSALEKNTGTIINL
jgi:ornithine cyclodeaminase/alanine dehydrogenase-like protein (mu-crystallin family)